MIKVEVSGQSGNFEVKFSKPIGAAWFEKVLESTVEQHVCWACGEDWAISPRDFGHGMCRKCFTKRSESRTIYNHMLPVSIAAELYPIKRDVSKCPEGCMEVWDCVRIAEQPGIQQGTVSWLELERREMICKNLIWLGLRLVCLFGICLRAVRVENPDGVCCQVCGRFKCKAEYMPDLNSGVA